MNTPTKINRLLVANRGEIAIRVFRTASEMGITTIALYTHEDRYSLHRYKADEAYQIGKPDQPLKPYLNIDEIIQLAKHRNIDAIHPGYGFLSENVTFAQRCIDEGILWVGPDPKIMDKLGDKIKAKEIAIKSQVPIIQSNIPSLTNINIAISEANRIGYPLIIKATAGGGGRGMRIVKNKEQLQQVFDEAKREALNAFGNDTVFIEKFIENPKHIEVQILGDKHKNIVHLYERDCSVQRRFQKVVEVAPAPSLLTETKNALYSYALRIARKVGYNNAGTVEFLVDKDENIYFIEVNPRIQVEHTVTEQITGIDIVRSQILIAAGHSLSSSGIFINNQEDIPCNGYAIQCRITTEDPVNNFKPDYGTIIAYRNAGGFDIRIDEGSIYSGYTVSPFFDSMLVKVTASGRTLKGASQRLHRALTEFRIRGVRTNIPFLENVVTNPTFIDGKATVKFIEEHPSLLQFTHKLDRATRLMQFIAHLTVNKNDDVNKIVEAKPIFDTPKIPDFKPFEPYPIGTKNKLNQLGRDKFIELIKTEKKVFLTDTTFRDAHQSLLATRFRTIDLLAVAEGFAKVHPQLFSMEVWGGATFDVALRFLHECPWKRLQLLRKAIPNILLQMLLRGSNAVGYSAYPDNLVEKFIEKSAETGIDVFRIFDSLNWIENMRTSIKAVNKHSTAIAQACICYTDDIMQPKSNKYNLNYYLTLAKQLEDAGAHMIAIKDMAGLLKPYAAQLLISELKNTVNIPIQLHTHDATSSQLATYLKAIEAGVDVVDVALAAMSGLGSQPNANTLIEILKATPYQLDIDITSMNQYSNYWEKVRNYYYPFESGMKASSAEVYTHEIPGGQYSNLLIQANSLGIGHKIDEIVAAYIQANELFGHIVKVTPSSKVVGDMALFMVSNGYDKHTILEKGNNIDFPESIKGFFKGELGIPPGGFPPKMQQIVLKGEKPLTERANAHLSPINFDAEFSEFQQQFDKNTTLLDFLSYKMYPKVFADYYKHYQKYGNVSAIPTPIFFYGMQEGEETTIEIGEGKTLLIRLMYKSMPDEDGYRNVHFKLNGQTRTVSVKDNSLKVLKIANKKVEANNINQLGAPLQGLLSKIFVKQGDPVQQGQPLFVIEAMKMETSITSPKTGTILQVQLSEGTLVQAEDLILSLA